MEWLGAFLTVVAFALLLLPLLVLVATVFVLVPLAHLAPRPSMVSRASFDCPFSRRKVNVAFLSSPESEQPSDVLSCSLFSDDRGIRCKKGCLALAQTGWTPSPIVPRYSLIADSVALR